LPNEGTARSARRSPVHVTFNAKFQFSCATGESQAGNALIWRQAVFRTSSLLRKVTPFAALIAATVAGQPHSVSAASRGELWFVVHDMCLPAYRSIGVAFPCAEVNIANGLDRGFAVLQAPSSAAHVIVVPTTRISGIESPALQSENAPNYWEAAWDDRRFVEQWARRDAAYSWPRLSLYHLKFFSSRPNSRSDLSSAIACRVAASGRAEREYAAIVANVSASHCVVATSTSLADRDAVTVFHPLVQARRAASFRRLGIVMRFCSSSVRIILATNTPSAMHASTAMIRHQTANLFTFVS
jgi:hypothetical protein